MATSIGQSKASGVRRVVAIGLGALLLALLLALVGYERATAPDRRFDANGRLIVDPDLTGRLEQRAWAAYYLHRWPELFDLLLRLSRQQFGLSLPAALQASYVATQAQVVFSRQGAEGGEAERDMRQFYEMVREPTGGHYDSARAAALELRWWVVHRLREQQPDRSTLTQALADSYAEVYQRPAEQLKAAADARAAAMDLSDRWNREGRALDSPLLDQIAELLVTSYRELRDATAS